MVLDGFAVVGLCTQASRNVVQVGCRLWVLNTEHSFIDLERAPEVAHRFGRFALAVERQADVSEIVRDLRMTAPQHLLVDRERTAKMCFGFGVSTEFLR